MIDTHCHLDVAAFDEDREEVLRRAFDAGLEAIIIPAIGPSSWEPLLHYPRRDRRVQVGLGIHPQMLPSLPPEDDERHLARLDALLADKQAIAVGECGLDGPSAAGAPMERQISVLRAHFELADRHSLPMLVHCLRAHPALHRLLKERRAPAAGLLMHSYSGSAELAKFYLAHGCHFSFAGPVSFAEARRPLDALRAIPLERLMVETDGPDQAPTPHRGRRNEPAYIPLIIEAMAAARGEPLEKVQEAVTQNARAFFGARWVASTPPTRA